jgi:hypothetical protein
MPQYYTLLQIADWYGKPVTTTWRHIKHLENKKRFEKKSIGRFYTEEETRLLGALMNFAIPNRFKRKAG